MLVVAVSGGHALQEVRHVLEQQRLHLIDPDGAGSVSGEDDREANLDSTLADEVSHPVGDVYNSGDWEVSKVRVVVQARMGVSLGLRESSHLPA